MNNHTLIVRKSNSSSLQASYDGQYILSQPSSDFLVEHILESHRRMNWNETLHSQEVLAVRTQIQFAVGPWPERFLKQPVGGLYLFKLPDGVEVTLTGTDFMSVVITMPPVSGGQGGYCGNFNGNHTDDFEYINPSFHKPAGSALEPIDPSESLFGSGESLVQTRGESQMDPEAVLADCSPVTMEMAHVKCEEVANIQRRKDCIFDVCATGLASAAEGVVAAELLETKVNARGIPLRVGSGRCLDAVGRQYIGATTFLEDAEDCKDVLRSLSLTPGVMGAQMQEGGQCEVLIASDVPTEPIKGGWGTVINEDAKGMGIICGTTQDTDWTCWQLA